MTVRQQGSAYRTRNMMFSEILKLADTPTGINYTRILYGAYLSPDQFNGMLKTLTENGMIALIKEGGKHKRMRMYRTTAKGRSFIVAQADVQNFLKGSA